MQTHAISVTAGAANRRLRRWGGLLALSIAMLLLAACPAKRLGFQGTLRDAAGNPLNGQYDIVFHLWTCESGTGSGCTNVYSQTNDDVQVTDGYFDVPIGTASIDANTQPDPAIFAQQLYLEIVIEGETLTPRQPLHGAPYAFTLVGGSIIIGTHAGPGGSDGTDVNYGSLTVVATGAKGTSLIINANDNPGGGGGGDLIRGCIGPVTGTNRACDNLRFRVSNNGVVTADGNFTGGGADFAEYMDSVGGPLGYAPGDVLVISPDQDRAVALSSAPYATSVIGVYSTDPAMIGGGKFLDDDGNTDMIPVGIVGIVPVKVSAENGPIQRGDLLTTSSTPGHAMRATEFVPGAILGKALGTLNEGIGVIEVVLLLQ